MRTAHPDFEDYHHLIGGGLAQICEKELVQLLHGLEHERGRLVNHPDPAKLRVVSELSYPAQPGWTVMELDETHRVPVVAIRDLFPNLDTDLFQIEDKPQKTMSDVSYTTHKRFQAYCGSGNILSRP